MTKKELVSLLENFPDDTIVLMPGHSDSNGYYDIDSVDEIAVCECHDWSGNYQPYGDYWKKEGFKKLVVCCIS